MERAYQKKGVIINQGKTWRFKKTFEMRIPRFEAQTEWVKPTEFPDSKTSR